jgi:hypothetical protein
MIAMPLCTMISMAHAVSDGILPRGWMAVGAFCVALSLGQAGMAKDLLPPKEQDGTEIGTTQSRSFDHQEKGVPLSLFTWIKLAKGFEVEWDTFGRTGWYTQDPRLKPIETGSTFTSDIPVIYLIFEVAPLEDPAQFAVQWFLEQPGGHLIEHPLGKDVLEVSGHERYGYLEFKKTAGRWPVGNYLAKIYITPLGQQPFHAVNQVGTMRFTIKDVTPAVSQDEKPAR